MNKKLRTYCTAIAGSLLVGALSAILTNDSMDIYQSIKQPPLAPPSLIFPIVWTVLFALMGLSAAWVYIANDYKWNGALTVYAVQLAVNFVWSLIFFNLRAFLLSFIWLIILWCLIIVMIYLFNRYDKKAALIQIPYLLWVTFAGYLNLGIYLLNR